MEHEHLPLQFTWQPHPFVQTTSGSIHRRTWDTQQPGHRATDFAYLNNANIPKTHFITNHSTRNGDARTGARVSQRPFHTTHTVPTHLSANMQKRKLETNSSTAVSIAQQAAHSRAETLHHQLTEFYQVYNPHQVTKVTSIVADFLSRGGGAKELEELNAELRQVSCTLRNRWNNLRLAALKCMLCTFSSFLLMALLI